MPMVEIGANEKDIVGNTKEAIRTEKPTKPPFSHRFQDALEGSTPQGIQTRREFLAKAAAGALGLTAAGLVAEGSPKVYKNEQTSSVPQSAETPTPKLNTDIQYNFSPESGDVTENTYKELFREGVRFAHLGEDGEWETSLKPEVKVMQITPVYDEVIVRHGPVSYGDNDLHIPWTDYQTINPTEKIYSVDLVGSEYTPGYSGLGSKNVHGSGDPANGIWQSIVEKSVDEDGNIRFFYSDVNGVELPEKAEPDCIAANYASLDTSI